MPQAFNLFFAFFLCFSNSAILVAYVMIMATREIRGRGKGVQNGSGVCGFHDNHGFLSVTSGPIQNADTHLIYFFFILEQQTCDMKEHYC